MVVDDHQVFAEMLGLTLVSEGFTFVGAAHTAASALDLARRRRPDIVVMDLQLGADSGLEAARRIRDELPATIVVAVSAHVDPAWAARASQAGACAYAPKSGSLSELLAVLRGARNGSMLIAPSFFEHRVPVRPASVPGPCEALTARELDVLRLMGQGLAPAAIARMLTITVNTCRGYIKSIHTKLGVSSQLEAVVTAQRHGIIAVA